MINGCMPLWQVLCDSHFWGFLWSPEHLSGHSSIILHLRRCEIPDNCCYYSLLTRSPNLPPVRVLNSRKKQTAVTGETLHCKWIRRCLPRDSVRKTNVRPPEFETGFFHADLIAECLVSFLSGEIWTTAYGRLWYFPLGVSGMHSTAECDKW